MRKQILFAIVFFASIIISVAQAPVLTAADFGTNVFYGVVSTASPNQVPTTYWVSVPVSSVPGASNFPNATSALKRLDNSDPYYELYETTATYHKQIARGGSPNVVTYNKLLFQFPFALNSWFHLTDGTVSYSSYGNLTTPWETCSNAITVYTHTAGGTGSNVYSNNEYDYIATNPYRVLKVQKIFGGGGAAYSYSYYCKYFPYESYLLNSEEFKTHSFSIFPNPTNGDFNIHNANAFTLDSFVTVYDVLGKIVLPKQLLTNEMQTIYSSGLASGLYIVKITDVENKLLQTEKVVKN